MLEIQTPTGCTTERAYTLSVLLDDWLGLPFTLSQGAGDGVAMRLRGQPGELRLPDVFFRQFDRRPDAWLSADSLPTLSPNAQLPQWDTRALAPDILLFDPRVPVLFGPTLPCLEQPAQPRAQASIGTHIDLPLDVFGAAFFMLARYEEAVLPDRDKHDRFPASASLAWRADFLNRPVIDEYVEILWTAMRQLWPALRRKTHQPRTLVSCDIDRPFWFNHQLTKIARRFAGDVLIRRSPTLALNHLRGALEARGHRYSRDPYRVALDWIMDINESSSNKVSFYFIPANTDPAFDRRYDLNDPRIRELLQAIHHRGHEIGIHPGYNTYRCPDAMGRSVKAFRNALDAAGIEIQQLGGRQHYLRWQTSVTARLYNSHGLTYDSTLTYPDRPGFRCGTCREYPLYDLGERRALKVRERPLILMECSLLSDIYMGMEPKEDALNMMRTLRDRCHHFNGNFTILWHNSFYLWQEDYQRLYQTIIQGD